MHSTQSTDLNLDPWLPGAVTAPEAAKGPQQLLLPYPAHCEAGECFACH